MFLFCVLYRVCDCAYVSVFVCVRVNHNSLIVPAITLHISYSPFRGPETSFICINHVRRLRSIC
jgi:hypothetical protein